MKHYIVIKAFPGATVGTVVVWNTAYKAYVFKSKPFNSGSSWDFNFIPAEEVENNKEYFCKASSYPEHYAWNNPVFSRKDIHELLDECIPNKLLTGPKSTFAIRSSSELQEFRVKLRKLGNNRAKELLDLKIIY